MVRCSRSGSSGSRLVGVRSKARPVAAGDHMCFCSPMAVAPAEPCTISMQASRTRPAAVLASAVRAGTIASRNGRATVAPSPFSDGAPRQVFLRDEHPESRLRVRAADRNRICWGQAPIAASPWGLSPCQCLAPAATGAVVVASGSSARLIRNASLATTPCTNAVTL